MAAGEGNTKAVCACWVRQQKSYMQNYTGGRNPKPTVFFRDSMIFSYGEHFMAGKIHTLKNGKRVALIRDYYRSPSTQRHLARMRQAAGQARLRYFDVPDVDPTDREHLTNVEYFKTLIEKFEKPVRTSTVNLPWQFDRMMELLREANDYARCFNVRDGRRPKHFRTTWSQDKLWARVNEIEVAQEAREEAKRLGQEAADDRFKVLLWEYHNGQRLTSMVATWPRIVRRQRTLRPLHRKLLCPNT